MAVAIALDASTPAVVTGSLTGNLTTASFSPPVGSLLVALVGGGWSNASMNATLSSTAGLVWTQAVIMRPTVYGPGGGMTAIYWAYVPTAPGSMTVTASYTNLGGGRMLAVRVLTGANSSQVGAATAGNAYNSNTSTPSVSLTTTKPGSWVFAIADNTNGNGTFTPNGSTSVISDYNDTNASDIVHLVSMKYNANPIATPSTVTLGGTWSPAWPASIAAMEVLPANPVSQSAFFAFF